MTRKVTWKRVAKPQWLQAVVGVSLDRVDRLFRHPQGFLLMCGTYDNGKHFSFILDKDSKFIARIYPTDSESDEVKELANKKLLARGLVEAVPTS